MAGVALVSERERSVIMAHQCARVVERVDTAKENGGHLGNILIIYKLQSLVIKQSSDKKY